MQYALSRRYFGVVLNAGDPAINYGSYKHLGLCCAFCKAPVFFVASSKRKAHQRQTKKGISTVKATSVQPHFAHFGEGEDAYPQTCEIRSKRLKQQEISQLNGQARDQRLKHLWIHFEQLVAKSMSPGGIPIASHADYQAACTEILNSIEFVAIISAKTEKYLRSSTKEFKHNCSIFLDKLIAHARKPFSSVGLALTDPDFFDSPPLELSNMDAWLLQIVPEAQKTLTEEAIDFLLFKRNQRLLEKLIFSSLYSVLSVIGKNTKVVNINFLIQQTINALMTSLTLCRWAENFAQLEALER